MRVIRKKDKQPYGWSGHLTAWPGFSRYGNTCVYLQPLGFGGRSHYKTLNAFMREFTLEDGAPVPEAKPAPDLYKTFADFIRGEK